jgi:hypothetical protein
MEYINKLKNFNGNQLASICQEDQYALYDEALCIYKNFKEHVSAIKIMIYKLNNLEGDMTAAYNYAEKIGSVEVWTELGTAQLDKNMLKECMTSFINAKNPSMYMMVINMAKN